jgi:surface antigen
MGNRSTPPRGAIRRAGAALVVVVAVAAGAAPARADLMHQLQNALRGPGAEPAPPAPPPPAPTPPPAPPTPAPAPPPPPPPPPVAADDAPRTPAPGRPLHNPFRFGQCTYHAFAKRPDIYVTAVASGVPRGRASRRAVGGVPDWWWNAWRWAGNAARAGIPTGMTPVRGAIAVFPRGYGGSPIGHVAYVMRTLGRGSYLVSERNWNHHSSITRRIVRPYPGVRFIYGGPAGRGPRRR